MALTAKQIEQRDGKLTASRVGILMSGDAEKILNLWKELVGDPTFVSEDLSAVWPVQLGSHSESLHLDWMQSQQGYTLLRRGDVVIHAEYPWASCTLDAWDGKQLGPIECKHVNNFAKLGDVRARYMPQLHWQMLCTGSKKAVLSVIVGANEPVQELVIFDEAYAKELLSRAISFWQCVESLTPPVVLQIVAAPVAPEKFRTVDMSSSNEWGNHAADWLANKKASKKFDKAVQEIKALVEADVGEAFGAGIVVKRSKAGSITIKEE